MSTHWTKLDAIKNFPISLFSVIMGCIGFVLSVQKATILFSLSTTLAFVGVCLSLFLFLLFSFLYATKIVFHYENVKNEFHHPVKINFFATFSICLLLFSIVFLPINFIVSKCFWIVGVIAHSIFTLAIVSSWMHKDRFKIVHMNPSWFIPAVGNILVPIAGVMHAPLDVSWFFYSVGLFFWIILMVIVFYRIIFHEPIVDKLLPTLFILIAPPAVGFMSYYKLCGSINEFSKMLYFFSLFLSILLFSQLKIYKKLKFFLSSWAYVFPLAALSIATFIMHQETASSIYKIFYVVLLTIITYLVTLFSYKTVYGIYRNEIFIDPARE